MSAKLIELNKAHHSNNNDGEIRKRISEIASKMDQKQLAMWASDCVEHVLSNFEENYPNDYRPRRAIEAARAWVSGEISVGEARSAALEAHAAARDAEDKIACAVARAAGHAAATAHVADHAFHAANYAAKVDLKELVWQYEKLLEFKINKRKKSLH